MKIRRLTAASVAALTTLAFTLSLPSAAQFAKPKAQWTAQLVPADARAGEGAQVVLTAKIEPEWHIYSLTPVKNGPVPTSFALPKETTALVAVGRPVQPAGR